MRSKLEIDEPKLNINQGEARVVLNSVLDVITETLVEEKNVRLVDFGTFSVIGPPFSILKGQILFSFWNSNLQAILHLDLFSKPENSKFNRLIIAVKVVKHGRFSLKNFRN